MKLQGNFSCCREIDLSSLRGAFCATKQSRKCSKYNGLLRLNATQPRNDEPEIISRQRHFIYSFFGFCVFALCHLPAYAADNWVAEALKLQREIDLDVPLNQATFIGTHNSYNSVAYQIPVKRYVDPNQSLSIREQLNSGIRSIELDAHYTFNDRFRKSILMCHGQANHFGCGLYDKPISDGLSEIKNWLQENPQELILLYIERHLDGHDADLVKEIKKYLGDYIFTPTDLAASSSFACMPLPTTLSKRYILSTGKQVLIVTKKCTPKNKYLQHEKWQDTIFTGIGKIAQTPYTFFDATITFFTPYPNCAKTTIFNLDPLHSSLWRIFEDRTSLSSVISPQKKLLPGDMPELSRCGINWPTVDFLHHADPRLAAAIWSWKVNYPQKDAGACVIYRINEGYENVPCDAEKRRFVCQQAETGEFKITALQSTWQQGEKACQSTFGSKWHFTVPVNGQQLYTVKERMSELGANSVWLNYALNDQQKWVANRRLSA